MYPVQIAGCDLRHMAETVQLAELVMENGNDQAQRGVKGFQPPNEMRRNPRRLSERIYWKAS